MRLIDADKLHEHSYECLMVIGHNGYTDDCVEEAPTVNAIPIPDGATNGDMIKAMFPNARVDDTSEKFGQLSICTHDAKSVFSSDWWNAPYKGGKE